MITAILIVTALSAAEVHTHKDPAPDAANKKFEQVHKKHAADSSKKHKRLPPGTVETK